MLYRPLPQDVRDVGLLGRAARVVVGRAREPRAGLQEDRGGKVDYEACLLALEEEGGGEVHA